MNELQTKPYAGSRPGGNLSTEVSPAVFQDLSQFVGGEVGDIPEKPRPSGPHRILAQFTMGRQLVAGDMVVAICFGIWWSQWTWPLLVGWALTVVSYASSGLYRPRLHLTLLDQVPQLLSQFVITVTIALTVPALLGVPLELRRHAFGAALMIGSMLAMRGIIFAVVRIGRMSGAVSHPTLVVGSGERAQRVMGVLERHRTYGLNVLGYVADRPVEAGSAEPADVAWRRLGTSADLTRVIRRHHIEILIIDDLESCPAGMIDGLRRKWSKGPSAFLVANSWEVGDARVANDHIGGVPIVRVSRGWTLGQRAGKRLFDLAMATASLVVLSPLMLLVALAVMAEDGHGPLFRQVRVGRNGKLFTMYKFRSMRPAAPAKSDTAWSGESEARIGRIGKFIRATSIDELPQLFNILRGDMTFVGPRPERPHYVRQFSATIPEYESRHRVAVGLTGLAQVSGLRGDTSIDDRVRHDNYYIDHWSLWFDIKVLIWTLGQAFGARGR
jgi:exopolysaccharide biosynthesis polyprenyl glycosylphosphotransferase